MRSAAAFNVVRSRPSITTDHPEPASPLANASPSPRDAPVTIATLMADHPSERQIRSLGEYNKDYLALFPEAHPGWGSTSWDQGAVVALPAKLASPSYVAVMGSAPTGR